MDRMNAEGARGRCVDRDVIDKNGAQRVDREAIEQDLVDARLRLDRADLARDHNAVEPAKEIKTLTREGEGLGRPVAERVERHVTIAQLLQDLDRAGDGSGQHLALSGAEGVDPPRLSGCKSLSVRTPSAKLRPASWWRCHSCVHTVARKCSI